MSKHLRKKSIRDESLEQTLKNTVELAGNREIGKMRIYSYQDGVTKLGPGPRFVLWTQGCPRCCNGCMTPDSQSLAGGREMSVADIVDLILMSGRDGLTISGGEPFIQAKELCELISTVKAYKDVGVIIYTGYTYEELSSSEDAYQKLLLELTDLLVDGPYIDELNDGKNLRGSSNQRVIALTKRYIDNVGEYGSKKAEIELFMKENRLILVGVPDKKTLNRLKKIYKED